MKTKEFWERVHSGEIKEGDTIVSEWVRSGFTQTCKVEYVLSEMLAGVDEDVTEEDLMIGDNDICHYESTSRSEGREELIEYTINP